TSPILPRWGTSSRRITCTAIEHSSRVGCGERQERHRPRPLDGERQVPLVSRAVAGDAARDDLAPLGEEGPEHARVLVVDHHGLVGAEAADLPPPHAPAAEPPSLALPAALAALPLCHLRRPPRSVPRTRRHPRTRAPRARAGARRLGAAAAAADSRPGAPTRTGARGPGASGCARPRPAPS